jgi:antibiotic biosynthesis monooxygenase (ABM) superfamily enzyme
MVHTPFTQKINYDVNNINSNLSGVTMSDNGYNNFLEFLNNPDHQISLTAAIKAEDTDQKQADFNLVEEGDAETFVDYRPLPRPPIAPPAKYKLCLVIWFTVYFVIWFTEGAGITKALIAGGLNLHGAVYITFMIEIFVMVFCSVELVIGLTRIKIGGKWYGILPWLMQPRWKWLRESENTLVEILAVVVIIAEDGFAIFTPAKPPPSTPAVCVFDLVDKKKEAVLRALHNVDPAKLEDYNNWAKRMIAHMESAPGFVAIDNLGVDKDGIHTWKLKFENIASLNCCMRTSLWILMMEELQHLLKSQKITQIKLENPPLNALVDVIIRQGDSTPVLPPKKWKVWWITTCAIYFSWLIANATVFIYFEKWGADTWNKSVYRILQAGTLVILLNYLVSPFMILFVNDWMIRKTYENEKKIPWKQLNDGFIPPVQILLCVIYFSVTGSVWFHK